MKKIKKYRWGEDPEMSGPRNYFRESLILSAIKKYIKNNNILDAGCGTGSLSIRLAEKGFHTVSIDTSFESIAYLKYKRKEMKLEKKINCQVGSILSLPFKKNTFNGIVCGEVLEHITNDKRVIKEFFRVLKKGGVCVVSVPAHPRMWDMSDEISSHKRRYAKEELKERFEDAGFQIKEVFYWGFPLNNLWHRYIFVPFLLKKMEQGNNITANTSPSARLVRNKLFQLLFSHVFYFDMLFNFTNLGNAALLIAIKK